MRPFLALALLTSCTATPSGLTSHAATPSSARLLETDQIYAVDSTRFFGWAVRGAGDIDGDGYDDFVATAPQHDSAGSGTGAIYVQYGSASGIDPARSVRVTASDAVEGAYFGIAAGAGDFDGDGYGDVVVGAYADATHGAQAGAVYLYPGSASGLDTSRELKLMASDASVDARFGQTVAGAGDVDGDGYDDLVVGAYGDGDCGQDGGAVYVYRGSASGIDSATELKIVPSDGTDRHYFGTVITGAGDLDGDGYDDIAVGANPSVDLYAGAAYVYYGGSSGIDTATEQKVTASDGQYKDYFGRVAGVGDLDGDGYDDLAVSAYGDDDLGSESGALYLYYGGASGLDVAREQKLNRSDGEAGEKLGLGLAGADLDGDGYADVLVSAFWDDDLGAASGSAYLFYGSAGGVDPSTEEKLLASDGAVADYFGYSVTIAGDIDGDGRTEVAIAAMRDDDVATDAGAVYIFSPESRDADGDGVDRDEDCDDDDASVGGPLLLHVDVDGDGFGDAAITVSICAGVPGHVEDGTDCDDGDVGVFPGAPDTCGDGVDADCDGIGGPTGDEDGDGLTAIEEAIFGTDDCLADSDGDGTEDADEIAGGTDPTVPDRATDTDEPGDEPPPEAPAEDEPPPVLVPDSSCSHGGLAPAWAPLLLALLGLIRRTASER